MKHQLAVAVAICAVACGDSAETDDNSSKSGTTTSVTSTTGSSTGGATGSGGAGVGGGGIGPFGTCGEAGPTGEHNIITLPSGQYIVWAPTPANPAQPYPLVVAMHGDEGHPDMAVGIIWGQVWNAHQDFVLVTPVCPSAQGSWWQGDTDGYAVYLHDVIADVSTKYNIDIARSFAVGYSGGSCWLSAYAFEFQDVFAGIQWTCGGCGPNVLPPPAPACKVDGRFHIAADDFLLQGAQNTADAMEQAGHTVDFVIASCSGHCCMNSPSDAEEALAWFLQRTKCDSTSGMGCGDITDLP